MSRKWARTISCVPSVEPVSAMTQASMTGRTESRQRRITGASFFTIMQRQMVWPDEVVIAFFPRDGCAPAGAPQSAAPGTPWWFQFRSAITSMQAR